MAPGLVSSGMLGLAGNTTTRDSANQHATAHQPASRWATEGDGCWRTMAFYACMAGLGGARRLDDWDLHASSAVKCRVMSGPAWPTLIAALSPTMTQQHWRHLAKVHQMSGSFLFPALAHMHPFTPHTRRGAAMPLMDPYTGTRHGQHSVRDNTAACAVAWETPTSGDRGQVRPEPRRARNRYGAVHMGEVPDGCYRESTIGQLGQTTWNTRRELQTPQAESYSDPSRPAQDTCPPTAAWDEACCLQRAREPESRVEAELGTPSTAIRTEVVAPGPQAPSSPGTGSGCGTWHRGHAPPVPPLGGIPSHAQLLWGKSAADLSSAMEYHPPSWMR